MTAYVVRRLVLGAVVLALVTIGVFLILHMIPGDAVSLQLQDASGVSEEQAEALRESFGLNDPVHVQLAQWAGDAIRGDLGESFWTGESVTTMFLDRVPVTLQLGAWSVLISTIVGIALGIVSAVRRGGWVDNAVRVFAVAGLSVPNYVVALLLLILLGTQFAWSPPLVYRGLFEDPVSYVQQLALPVFALASGSVAAIARMTRSSMLEALNSNYIRTVRAKGATSWLIYFKHALRNSSIPVFTLVGVHLATVLGGTVILETLFGLPGTGQLIYDSVLSRDYPVVVACTIFYAGLFVLTVILIDLVYAVIDPRIRTGKGS
ncbi:ABC transporter permease [Solwaraspora sp. WMMB335]|uniref:ABC transporter permease n=1 Tax=Solwaraspora sp. WMMB335 TaxID=3404118 RepID=UPI003B92E203